MQSASRATTGTVLELGKILTFVSQFLDGQMTLSRDSEAMINARIAQIDHLVSIQLNEVMHNAAFQKLQDDLVKTTGWQIRK